MVESTFNIRRLGGVLLIAFGMIGFSYLGWTYYVWGAMLPSFGSSNVFHTVSDEPEQIGFADLMREPEEAETVAEDSSLLNLQRVLGSNDGYDVLDEGEVRLSVPRLGIADAIVSLDVDGEDERIYDTILTRAIAHLKKSAYPGQIGNTFIFGHSKLPIFAGSDYESIFTNLPKVKVGDVVEVTSGNMKYTYQISQTGVVEPNDVFIMNQPQTKRMITLMTCIPPGFANQRYVTVGELIQTVEL